MNEGIMFTYASSEERGKSSYLKSKQPEFRAKTEHSERLSWTRGTNTHCATFARRFIANVEWVIISQCAYKYN